ncbi:GlcG/HbpS family heme-binding protein [Rahnella sp. PCH160]|uniref:GlcG/HbpS family heme-binding protein n=1 Tax=Rahnella sp. PCH160 TaxID=3447928 RepID=UPI0039FCB0A3
MTAPTSHYFTTASISAEAAQTLLMAAIKAAAALGVEISAAVVDNGGILKAFIRNDAAPFLTVDAAINKAWTSASFGYPTHVWNSFMNDPQLAPISHVPKVLAVGGGFPLMFDGKIIGGLGISGGPTPRIRKSPNWH